MPIGGRGRKTSYPLDFFASAQAVAQGSSVLAASQEFRLSRLGALHRLTQVPFSPPLAALVEKTANCPDDRRRQRFARGFLLSLQFRSRIFPAGYCWLSLSMLPGRLVAPVGGRRLCLSSVAGGDRPLAMLALPSPAMAQGDGSCGGCRASSSRDLAGFRSSTRWRATMNCYESFRPSHSRCQAGWAHGMQRFPCAQCSL